MSQYVAHHSRLSRKQSLSQYAARHSRAARDAADQYVGRHALLRRKPVSRQRSSKGGWTRFLAPVLFLFGPRMTMFGLGAGRASPGEVTRNTNVQHRHTSAYGGWSDPTEISPTERTLVTRRTNVGTAPVTGIDGSTPIGDISCGSTDLAPGVMTGQASTTAHYRERVAAGLQRGMLGR